MENEEIMICSAAREIKNGDVVFVGTGLPLRAAFLAKKVHAPDSVILGEMGSVDPDYIRPPRGVSDPVNAVNAVQATDMIDILGVYLHHVDVAFLGAAQIDKYGNINTTVIGDYFSPKIRMTGSGGANDVVSVVGKVVVVTRHEKRRFVERVDYITSPGNVVDGKRRRDYGLPDIEIVVITDLCIFRLKDGIFELESIHPGVSVSHVIENTGFSLDVERGSNTPQPSKTERGFRGDSKIF